MPVTSQRVRLCLQIRALFLSSSKISTAVHCSSDRVSFKRTLQNRSKFNKNHRNYLIDWKKCLKRFKKFKLLISKRHKMVMTLQYRNVF